MDEKLLAALIGGGVSLVVTTAGLIFNPITQRSLQKLKQGQDEEIAKLKSRLDESTAERKAQRDYEYEARKRLYAEIQPLILQIGIACDLVFSRMTNLAKIARLGHLDGRRRSWLVSDEYYIYSTVHRLLLLGSHFQVLREKATQLDFNLDPKFAALYVLLRESYVALTAEFNFAGAEPRLDYRPYDSEAETRVDSEPERFRRQGAPTGVTDNALALMVVAQEGGRHRVRRVGELQAALEMDATGGDLERFFELVRGFHPQRRPVLWRIMCAEACLAYVGWRAVDSAVAPGDLPRAVEAFCRDARTHALFALADDEPAIARAAGTFAAVERVLVKALSRRDLLDEGR